MAFSHLIVGLQKGHLIDEIHTLGQTWQFVIRVTPLSNAHTSWVNILHATIGEDNANYGDRTPAIFFKPQSTVVHICSAVNGNRNFCIDSPTPLPLNVVTQIVVRQYLSNGAYLYQVTVAEQDLFSTPVQNNQARSFENVKVYASDPFFNEAPDSAILNAYNYSDP